MYLLDTNTCIRYLNQRSESITTHLLQTSETEIAVCSVVKAELYFGAMKSNNPERTLEKQRAFVERFVSFPFDDKVANIYAQMRANLERLGTPIGSNDLMIASIAHFHNLVLVTHNMREFERIHELQLEDWEVSRG